MTDQYKNVMIALFVLAASAVGAFILLFIHPDVGDEQKLLRVRFSDIDKVTIGTRVTYGGKPVGEVVEVREIESEKDPRQSKFGQVYLYELDLRVDSSVNVYNSDELSLRTSGLLGEKSVSITPMPPKPGQKLRNVDNEVIYAMQVGSVEQTFKEFKELADKFDQALDNVNKILEDLQADGTFKSFARTANNLSDITDALNQPQELNDIISGIHSLTSRANDTWPTIDKAMHNIEEASDHVKDIAQAVNQPDNISDIVDNVHTLTENAVAVWDSVEEGLEDFAKTTHNTQEITAAINQPKKLEGIVDNVYVVSDGVAHSWPKIDKAVSAVTEVAVDTKQVVRKLRKGEGTFGKLLMEDDLYLQVKAILNKGEIVANDVNHYGLLFHLDKDWQRIRARRMNLLSKLCTPQEFYNYFNDEIDLISTSLSRVSMVIDKNSALYPCGVLLDDKEFAKVYAELLRRVESMEEALQMYNQQLADMQLAETTLNPCCH